MIEQVQTSPGQFAICSGSNQEVSLPRQPDHAVQTQVECVQISQFDVSSKLVAVLRLAPPYAASVQRFVQRCFRNTYAALFVREMLAVCTQIARSKHETHGFIRMKPADPAA